MFKSFVGPTTVYTAPGILGGRGPTLDFQDCKKSVHSAMVVLGMLAIRCKSAGAITEGQKALANACLAGIIIYGTFPGRSGEWHAMEASAVKEALDRQLGYIVCSQHKSCRYYGSIAKWLPPGLQEAFRVYLSLPGKTSKKFLEPARSGGADHFSLGPALRTFGRLFTEGYEFPRVNLIRKVHHSILVRQSRTDDLLKEVGQADGHSPGMAMKVYALSGPREDMLVGRSVYLKVFGEPVPWPEEHEFWVDFETLDQKAQHAGYVLNDPNHAPSDLNFEDDGGIDDEDALSQKPGSTAS